MMHPKLSHANLLLKIIGLAADPVSSTSPLLSAGDSVCTPSSLYALIISLLAL
jgi:hypothetical protein